MNILPKLLSLLPGLLLAGCAAPRASAPLPAFGATARAAFARQAIALPSAAPVTGIDGAAALQGQQTYRKSFAEREPYARPLIIGVGAQK
jgi:hypothetical protein